jgi:hypothetical protein
MQEHVLHDRHQLLRHDPEMWCIPKVDGEFAARMEDVLALYAESPDARRPVVSAQSIASSSTCSFLGPPLRGSSLRARSRPSSTLRRSRRSAHSHCNRFLSGRRRDDAPRDARARGGIAEIERRITRQEGGVGADEVHGKTAYLPASVAPAVFADTLIRPAGVNRYSGRTARQIEKARRDTARAFIVRARAVGGRSADLTCHGLHARREAL